MQEILEIFNNYNFSLETPWRLGSVITLLVLIGFMSFSVAVFLAWFVFGIRMVFGKKGHGSPECIVGVLGAITVFAWGCFWLSSSYIQDKIESEEDTQKYVLFERSLTPNQLKELNLTMAKSFKYTYELEEARKDDLKAIGEWKPNDITNSQTIQFNQRNVLFFLYKEARLNKERTEKEELDKELEKLKEQNETSSSKLFKGRCAVLCEKE